MSAPVPVPLPEVGAELPALRTTLTLTDLIVYAGATWDWHRLHYDPAYLAAHGLPAPVVDGQLFGALLVRQTQEAFGPKAFVRGVHFRFARPVFAGETVMCAARVTARERQPDGTVRVSVAASVEVVGERARVAVAPAGLEVELR